MVDDPQDRPAGEAARVAARLLAAGIPRGAVADLLGLTGRAVARIAAHPAAHPAARRLETPRRCPSGHLVWLWPCPHCAAEVARAVRAGQRPARRRLARPRRKDLADACCPRCGGQVRVTNSRVNGRLAVRIRYRRCCRCGHRLRPQRVPLRFAPRRKPPPPRGG